MIVLKLISGAHTQDLQLKLEVCKLVLLLLFNISSGDSGGLTKNVHLRAFVFFFLDFLSGDLMLSHTSGSHKIAMGGFKLEHYQL